jgi:signal transduction histidine kinase
MAQNHLGLFDTPPTREAIRAGLAIVGLLFAALIIVWPQRNIPLATVSSFIPMVDAFTLVGELIISAQLYAQAVIFRSRALIVLASGYVFGALLLIPHALTFPGVFAENGLLGGGLNTTPWLAAFWRLTLPVAIILYVLLKRADSALMRRTELPAAKVFVGLSAAVTLAAAATLLATAGHRLLPPFFLNEREVIRVNLLIVTLVTISFTIAALIMLFRQKASVLDLWLLVALSAWLAQLLLNLLLHARYTLGWYCLWGMTIISTLVVMLALIAESGRLYARLALSAAARQRESDARLMSVEAVTAWLAQEIGQPLAAVKLSATAGLDWLERKQPDSDQAMESFRSVLDGCRRTFEAIKAVQSSFAKEFDSVSQFDLNDLLRETISVLDRELAARNIALKLALDEAVPPIVANRLRLQRVFVNLLTTPIEFGDATRRRTPRIEVRSALLDSGDVLIEVSAPGGAVAPEKLAHIMEPFVGARSTDTELSLSRTIVEEHGGRLWASHSEENGAIFHVQLPARRTKLP